MSQQHDLENELRELFDGSAEAPSGADLTRLRARAADVPERAPRTPRWLPRWVWAPALGGICAGAGALGALWLSEGPLAVQAPSEELPAVVSAAPPPTPSASAALSIEERAEDPFASDDEPLSFDLSADVPDAELDAWLEALEGS